MPVAVAAVLALLLLGLPSDAGAQPARGVSRCADCHIANPGSMSGTHLAEWDLSAHGRRNVGCEACHGGDPTSFEPFVAHRGVLARSNLASPVHRRNEPAGRGPSTATARVRRYEFLPNDRLQLELVGEGGRPEARVVWRRVTAP